MVMVIIVIQLNCGQILIESAPHSLILIYILIFMYDILLHNYFCTSAVKSKVGSMPSRPMTTADKIKDLERRLGYGNYIINVSLHQNFFPFSDFVILLLLQYVILFWNSPPPQSIY